MASFYDRPTGTVARELLGAHLWLRSPAGLLQGRVVETEAYLGPHDLACHASKGLTPRTEVLYGPPGRAYVYLCYGLHWLLNAVTEPEGHGSAVLIRAVEPVSGFPPGARLSGPALLTRAYGVDGRHHRADLTSGDTLWFSAGEPPEAIACGPRIGVDYAGEWAAAPLRFWIEGNAHVSRPRKVR